MSEGEIYPQKVYSDNLPGFIKRNALITSNNYLHTTWREDKERFHQRIYFAISLSLTLISAIFIGWISILVLLNLLTILLIFSTKKHNNQKERFYRNRKEMKKSFKEWGLEWRD